MFFSQILFYFQKNIGIYIKKLMIGQFVYQLLFFILIEKLDVVVLHVGIFLSGAAYCFTERTSPHAIDVKQHELALQVSRIIN